MLTFRDLEKQQMRPIVEVMLNSGSAAVPSGFTGCWSSEGHSLCLIPSSMQKWVTPYTLGQSAASTPIL